MIDYTRLEFDIFGDVVVQTDPDITTTKEWFEQMVENKDKRTPMWVEIISNLKEKGIITE